MKITTSIRIPLGMRITNAPQSHSSPFVWSIVANRLIFFAHYPGSERTPCAGVDLHQTAPMGNSPLKGPPEALGIRRQRYSRGLTRPVLEIHSQALKNRVVFAWSIASQFAGFCTHGLHEYRAGRHQRFFIREHDPLAGLALPQQPEPGHTNIAPITISVSWSPRRFYQACCQP